MFRVSSRTIHIRIRAWALVVLVGLPFLISLAVLGRTFTPTLARVFTSDDWQVLQIRQAYQSELVSLQRDATVLIELLNGRTPDPVRGQLLANQIAQRWASGQPALAMARQLLIAAAQAVSDWSIGIDSHEAARLAVEQALNRLQEQ